MHLKTQNDKPKGHNPHCLQIVTFFICCFVCAENYFFDFLSYLPPSLSSASARVILPLLQSAMV